MGLFNFRKNNEREKAAVTMLPVINPAEQPAETVCTDSANTSDSSSDKKTLTVSYATGWPIDIIYGYLHKNFEQKGFDDALVKNDMAFRDMNMNIIRNKILMVFREINLNYDVMKGNLETNIEKCRAAGLISTVADLERQMTVINTHQKELAELEEEFRNNSSESVPLQSYDCGFLRGMATIILSSPNNNVTMAQAPTASTMTSNRVSA